MGKPQYSRRERGKERTTGIAPATEARVRRLAAIATSSSFTRSTPCSGILGPRPRRVSRRRCRDMCSRPRSSWERTSAERRKALIVGRDGAKPLEKPLRLLRTEQHTVATPRRHVEGASCVREIEQRLLAVAQPEPSRPIAGKRGAH